MKILVTGAKGQVGSELVQQGKAIGFDMIVAGRLELDVSNREGVDKFVKIHQPNIIINAAAYTAVDQAETESDLAYAINYEGASNLARVCAEVKIPLFHISTDYVFDGQKTAGYVETDTPNPQGVYGKSKLAGDLAIESILKEHIILRVSWVFGANGSNFVKTMLKLGKQQGSLRVVADQYGSPTSAAAIAGTLLFLALRLNDRSMSWGTYHYSCQPSTTWHEFAGVVFDTAVKLGLLEKQPTIKPISTAEYPTLAVRPFNSVLNCDKIIHEFNVSPPDWRDELNTVLADLK